MPPALRMWCEHLVTTSTQGHRCALEMRKLISIFVRTFWHEVLQNRTTAVNPQHCQSGEPSKQ